MLMIFRDAPERQAAEYTSESVVFWRLEGGAYGWRIGTCGRANNEGSSEPT
jgi:hypothetical protein